jgi:transcriptional regulator with XRE-family HTH domain
VFFDIFSELSKKKGVSVYKACIEMGLNRSAVAKWKAGATPNGSTLTKMADYFGVSVGYLLGAQKPHVLDVFTGKAPFSDILPKEKTPTQEGEREIGFDDFDYALYNESKDLPEEKKQMLLSMARFMRQEDKKGK